MNKSNNIAKAVRKAYLQKESIALHEVGNNGIYFDIQAKSDAMFTMLAVSITHKQMEKWVHEWFTRLPQEEQTRLLDELNALRN